MGLGLGLGGERRDVGEAAEHEEGDARAARGEDHAPQLHELVELRERRRGELVRGGVVVARALAALAVVVLLADDHLVRADHDVVRERGERVGRRVAALDGEERGQRAAHVDERRVEAADGGELQLEPVGCELVEEGGVVEPRDEHEEEDAVQHEAGQRDEVLELEVLEEGHARLAREGGAPG